MLLKIIRDKFISFFIYLGELYYITKQIAKSVFSKNPRIKLTLEHIVNVGFESQTIIIMSGGFTGAVFAAQSFYQLNRIGLDSFVGSAVSVAMFRELGPAFVALMITGRIGAAMAAQLGTMKVTDQIDALRSLSIHPVRYLIAPRTIAMMISMPFLVVEAVFIGIIASYILMVNVFHVSGAWYLHHMKEHTNLEDLSISLIKGFFFGFLIVIISCHQGLKAKNGAIDVGRRTTSAVVFSSLAIITSNFFLTLLLNIFSPAAKQY